MRSAAAGTLDVVLDRVALRLDARGGVVDSKRRVGFVSDLHLGKTTHFRRRGLAVPEGDERRDLGRLAAFVRAHELDRLVVLGDLVHTASGLVDEVEERFAAWIDDHPGLAVRLVLGNHDRGAGALPRAWRVDIVDGPIVDGALTLCHEPPDRGIDTAGLTLAGHLHPTVTLGSSGRGARLRARCFWYRRGVLVLPAFGTFTGGHRIRARAGDRLFVIPPPTESGPPAASGSPVPPEVLEIDPEAT
ncbi:MAG: ligase-associated DNA damage response endonuclease PdeM [Gemmatimonadetes bacterium]|nr:ligase-associated DNA damage response endonuclease PdeM [Gemmatimonadota bacterium]MBT8403379.1 ligase-associated DNA damage response endonuclease PdeM [Gemmatimonadota bacterium]NNK61969.1 ligase-associated DNA damage response endonuclease PdeM [Gemmatimonadota bacterium]